jgi:hypothetical protein
MQCDTKAIDMHWRSNMATLLVVKCFWMTVETVWL